MAIDLFAFRLEIDAVAIAGTALWALALYLGLASIRHWIVAQLNRWFNFAERSLYLSTEEFERTQPERDAQNAFFASLLSIVPFLLLGALFNYGIEVGLGRSWSISVGLMACVASAVYDLGRKQEASKNDP